MFNGSIDGFTAIPKQSIGLNTWLIQRRQELNFLEAVGNHSGSAEINVYPNPVNTNSISFSFSESDIGEYQEVLIYSIQGRLILKNPIYSEFNHHIIELSESMANGMYLLKLSGTGGEVSTKFMVLRSF